MKIFQPYSWKIFIAEDEAEIRRELSVLLQKYGYACESSTDFARIQKLLKRTYEAQANAVLSHKGLTLNLLKTAASYGDQEIDLTKNELGILRLLIVNKGYVIPRDAILVELWQQRNGERRWKRLTGSGRSGRGI